MLEQTGTVEKALELLFHLHAVAKPCGVSDLARQLSMPKSSVHRLLNSLSTRALIEQDEDGRYKPGVGLVALGLGVIEREPVVTAARPVLEQSSRELGETLFVVAARAGRLIVLDKVEGTGVLRAAPSVGSTLPVHATAAGKLYLAHAPELVETPPDALQTFTERTNRTARKLQREVALAKQDGYAFNREEWVQGLCVVGAPIMDDGPLRGVIVAAIPTQRFDALGMEMLGQTLASAGRRVAARLAGRLVDGVVGGLQRRSS
jgi:DNA-binding IclR family transcriptional regulator